MNRLILNTQLVHYNLCQVYFIVRNNLSVIFSYMLLLKLRKYMYNFIIKKIMI